MALTIRTTEADEEKINRLKNALEIKSSSKLLLHLVDEHEGLIKKIDRLEKEKYELENKLVYLENTLRKYIDARNNMDKVLDQIERQKTPDCCLNCHNFSEDTYDKEQPCLWGLHIPYKKKSCKRQNPINIETDGVLEMQSQE